MRRVTSLLVVVGLLAACGGAASESSTAAPDETTTTTVVIPTAEELAAALLTPDEVGDGWEYTEAGPGGVVTRETRDLMPWIGACPESDPAVQELAEGLEWQAFTQIDLVDPGLGVAGRAEPAISLQEYVLAGDPVEVRASFEALEAAVAACSGVEWELEDGTLMRTDTMPVPSIGDAVFGERAVMPVPGDRRRDIRTIALVEGDVLTVIVEGEAGIPADADSVVSPVQLDAIITTASEKLDA